MNLSQIETGLKINKQTAIKMASEVFVKSKRVTEVHIRSYDRLVVLSYRGNRENELEIRNGVQVVRVVKLEEREVA